MNAKWVWSETEKVYFLRVSNPNRPLHSAWVGIRIFEGYSILGKQSYWYISSREDDHQWWTVNEEKTKSQRMRFKSADDAKAYALFMYESQQEN